MQTSVFEPLTTVESMGIQAVIAAIQVKAGAPEVTCVSTEPRN